MQSSKLAVPIISGLYESASSNDLLILVPGTIARINSSDGTNRIAVSDLNYISGIYSIRGN